MKKQKQLIICITLLVLLIVCLSVIFIVSGHVTANPPGTVGNTPGNLNNSGLFCEYDGKVYFANSFDGCSLFSMNSDETDLKKLNSLEVQNILAGGKYLYYFQTGASSTSEDYGFGQLPGIKSFDRCKLNGTDSTALTRDVVTCGQLVDNHLYLLTTSNSGISFYKTDIKGSERTILADYIINPACARDGMIYYNGTESNHYLYALDTSTDVAKEIWAGNLWYPVLEGNYVYYMDVANNYRLCRYSLSAQVIEVLTNDRVDCFNVGGGYIYYQKNSTTPQLICMRTDGTEAQVIADGVFTDINMTSYYVYFREFGDDVTLYHSPLGSGSYEVFSAAKAAVK